MTVYLTEGFGAYANGTHPAGAGAAPRLVWTTWTGSSLTIASLESSVRGVRKFATMVQGTNLQKDLSSLTTITVGIRLKTTGGPSIICSFYDGGSVMGWVGMRHDNRICYSLSSSHDVTGTEPINAGVAFPLNTYQYLEVKIAFHNTLGTIEFRYNGLTEATFTNQDTIGSGATCTRASFGHSGSFDDWNNSNEFTDIYFASDFLFPTKFYYKKGSAAGSQDDFTPTGAATSHEAIDDDAQDGDTTYTESTTVTDKLQVAHAGDLTEAPKTVWPVCFARNNGGGGNLKVGVLSGATDDLSAAKATAATYDGIQGSVYENDPNTSSPWTLTAANAMELSIEHA